MVAVRNLAAAVGIVYGAWGLYTSLYWPGVPAASEVGGLEILVVSVLLILASAVCFVGFRLAFYFSAAVAVILLARFLLSGLFGTAALDVAVVLCIATIALDVLGARHRAVVAEENHPLNLPVFG